MTSLRLRGRVPVLVLVVASLVLVSVYGVARVALAGIRINFDTEAFWIHFYDANNNELMVSTHVDLESVPAYWQDDNGAWYHCVEPFAASYVTEDLKSGMDAVAFYRTTGGLSSDRAKELVDKLAHSWKWCEDNYSGNVCGAAQQLLIWELEFDYGLKGINYGPSSYSGNYVSVDRMWVDSGGAGLDSNDLYNRFMAYYNGLAAKGGGKGIIMVPDNGSSSQKVGRFELVPTGFAKVTKQASA